MSDWLQTYSGEAFDPFNPDLSKIHIGDIAHALALTCRYGGHVNRFYSVAEHSVIISMFVPPAHAKWGLLHDATEAYVGDLVLPIKHRMPEFQVVEYRLQCAIMTRFGLPCEEPPEVKAMDRRICVDEKRALMSREPMPWGFLEGVRPLGAIIEALPPHAAEQEFLDRFEELF